MSQAQKMNYFLVFLHFFQNGRYAEKQENKKLYEILYKNG